jgi:hypothetical protein
MNNREVIDQVERGYRMAQPSHITYPESKTMPKEVAIAQANVYKVSPAVGLKKTNLKLYIFLYSWILIKLTHLSQFNAYFLTVRTEFTYTK